MGYLKKILTTKEFNSKMLYKNGDLRILGSKNIYAKWNGLMFFIYTKRNTDMMPLIWSAIFASLLTYIIFNS